jgi:hypothetical protein
MMQAKFVLTAGLLLLSLTACQEKEQGKTRDSAPPAEATSAALGKRLPGCQGCHAQMRLDSKHDFACTDCHQGDSSTSEKQAAHAGLISRPAAPANMTAVCGECHAQQVEGCAQSAHFTLKNEVNLIRSHFGLAPLAGLTAIPEHSGPPQNKEELVDDLLRRRCLRCHVYTAGDRYPYVRRGLGCAACHLRKTKGKLDSHAFTLPGERQCLSCHYGNRIGSDFAGMYEHDYSDDFRSPQVTPKPFLRPYGVEQHDLAQDVHRQRGLTCIDCHSGAELSGQQQAVQCTDCHSPETDKALLLHNVRTQDGQLILTARQNGKEHLIPMLTHPAHVQYGGKVACQVCHGQWSFNDHTTHLLLTYSEDTDDWESLAVQSNFAAEQFLTGEAYSPVMPDSLTGKSKAGLWLQGYSLRRWEKMLIRQDADGMIKVFRPVLALRLAAADAHGKVIAGLDNITGGSEGLLPYTPHTTGPAGLFYEQRFRHLLQEKTAQSKLNRDRFPLSEPISKKAEQNN